MTEKYDVIVIGLGAMGASGLFHLASQGLNVLGIERFSPPHKRGSSHGHTRVIREAYFEDPAYVPLLQRAYKNWQKLEAHSQEKILHETGGLMIGPKGSHLYEGALRSAKTHQLPHQCLSSAEIQAHFPAFVLPENMCAVQEERTGFLYPEKAISAYLRLAQMAGAQIQTQTEVLNWSKEADTYCVNTRQGPFYASKLVLTAGAWTKQLLPDIKLPLRVSRQSLFWFEPLIPQAFQVGAFPVFVMEYQKGQYLYGFPDEGLGFKIALHVPGETLDPENLAQEWVANAEVDAIRGLLMHYFPGANGPLKESCVCMYTMTPDQHFILDWYPQAKDLLVVSACSGHGFKFASVIGEIIADFCQTGQSDFDLSLFALDRLI